MSNYNSINSLYDMKKQIDAVMANEAPVTWTDKKGEAHTTQPITVYVDKGGREYTDKQTGETKTTQPSMSITDHRSGGSDSYSVIPYTNKSGNPDLVLRDSNKNYINKADLEKYDDKLRACFEVPINEKGRLYAASKGAADKEASSAAVQPMQASQTQVSSGQYDPIKSLYDMKKQIDAVMANEEAVTWTDKKGEAHTTKPITAYVDKGGKEYTDKQTGETKTTSPSMSITDHRNGGSESYSVIPYEKDNKPDFVIRDPNKNYINKTDLEKYDEKLRACLEVPVNEKGRLYAASKGKSMDKVCEDNTIQIESAEPQADTAVSK